jgi:hypothetical protein
MNAGILPLVLQALRAAEGRHILISVTDTRA